VESAEKELSSKEDIKEKEEESSEESSPTSKEEATPKDFKSLLYERVNSKKKGMFSK
jgi:hypothetical protein